MGSRSSLFKVPCDDTEHKALLCLVPQNDEIAREICAVCGKPIERIYEMKYYGWGQYFPVAIEPLCLPTAGEPMCITCASELWFRCACCQRIVREFRGRSRSFIAERTYKDHWFAPMFCRQSLCRTVEAVWVGTCWGKGSPKGWTMARDRARNLGYAGVSEWGAVACLKVLLEHESRNSHVRRRSAANTPRDEAAVRGSLRTNVGHQSPTERGRDIGTERTLLHSEARAENERRGQDDVDAAAA